MHYNFHIQPEQSDMCWLGPIFRDTKKKNIIQHIQV